MLGISFINFSNRFLFGDISKWNRKLTILNMLIQTKLLYKKSVPLFYLRIWLIYVLKTFINELFYKKNLIPFIFLRVKIEILLNE